MNALIANTDGQNLNGSVKHWPGARTLNIELKIFNESLSNFCDIVQGVPISLWGPPNP